MSVSKTASSPFDINWLEIILLSLVLFGGFLFLRNAPHWGHTAYVGSAQFGDAEFWWNGALHFSQGIVKENPNLTYRMGYATFGGLIAAVVGPDYRIFHQILLVVFLTSTCGLYVSLRGIIGRIAAAFAAIFLVFNPYTAEWLAISTSDGLGFVCNLLALLCLIEGVRDKLRFRWIIGFGILFSCASLTRPLMTPFLAPAALVVVIAAWQDWRKIATGLGLMLGAFMLPTIAWMAFMAASTGNFALTGESQDSSAFYAASDPQIQVWSGDMYTAVNDSAKKHFQTDQPTPQQLNAEFWRITKTNYFTHWRYHLKRWGLHTVEIASFTPNQAASASIFTKRWRGIFKCSLTTLLTIMLLRQRRFKTALIVGTLGAIWLTDPLSQVWLVLGAGWLGLTALFGGKRVVFIWTIYWWVGVVALYLTGGTWGPPLGGLQDLNALGYRLGFQFFSVADLLVVGLLGGLTANTNIAPAYTYRLLKPSRMAARLSVVGLRCVLVLLILLLGTGAAIVTWRMIERASITPTPYPSLDTLTTLDIITQATPQTEITPLRVAINAHTGESILTRAMTSGFVWNLNGQERSMLLLYQQDDIKPIKMSPRGFYAEIPRHVDGTQWRNRQGVWIIRSFPNTAQTSNLPYYLEMPAVQAFIPLTHDGTAYDIENIIRFPLKRSATQLAGSGLLTVIGSTPEWSQNSGTQQFPRRFALRASDEGFDQTIRIHVDLSGTSGQRSLSFAVDLESTIDDSQRSSPAHLHIGGVGVPTGTLWERDLPANSSTPLKLIQAAPESASVLTLTAYHMRPGDTLWFYELVLTADNFTH